MIRGWKPELFNWSEEIEKDQMTSRFNLEQARCDVEKGGALCMPMAVCTSCKITISLNGPHHKKSDGDEEVLRNACGHIYHKSCILNMFVPKVDEHNKTIPPPDNAFCVAPKCELNLISTPEKKNILKFDSVKYALYGKITIADGPQLQKELDMLYEENDKYRSQVQSMTNTIAALTSLNNELTANLSLEKDKANMANLRINALETLNMIPPGEEISLAEIQKQKILTSQQNLSQEGRSPLNRLYPPTSSTLNTVEFPLASGSKVPSQQNTSSNTGSNAPTMNVEHQKMDTDDVHDNQQRQAALAQMPPTNQNVVQNLPQLGNPVMPALEQAPHMQPMQMNIVQRQEPPQINANDLILRQLDQQQANEVVADQDAFAQPEQPPPRQQRQNRPAANRGRGAAGAARGANRNLAQQRIQRPAARGNVPANRAGINQPGAVANANVQGGGEVAAAAANAPPPPPPIDDAADLSPFIRQNMLIGPLCVVLDDNHAGLELNTFVFVGNGVLLDIAEITLAHYERDAQGITNSPFFNRSLTLGDMILYFRSNMMSYSVAICIGERETETDGLSRENAERLVATLMNAAYDAGIRRMLVLHPTRYSGERRARAILAEVFSIYVHPPAGTPDISIYIMNREVDNIVQQHAGAMELSDNRYRYPSSITDAILHEMNRRTFTWHQSRSCRKAHRR